MDFVSRSQAGQDFFTFRVLDGLTTGTFLDIGAGHPTELSNSYALEQLGWRGFLVEQEPNAVDMLRKGRASTVMHANALTQDWRDLPVKAFDYISLDVDYISHKVLLDLLVAGITARVWTIEHNEWNYPIEGSPRWAQRALMEDQEYDLICWDVKSQDQRFEDWYVQWDKLTLEGRSQCNLMRGVAMDGREIVGLPPLK